MPNSFDRRGQSLVGFLLILPVLIGALGLAVDLGWSYYRQEAAEAAGQAAALASATYAGSQSSGNPVCGTHNVVCQSATKCPNTLPSPAVTNIDVACQYAKDNGFANSAGGVQNVMVASGTGTPTGLTGVSVSYWVQVTTAESIAQTFTATYGGKYGQISARSTAGYMKSSGGCIYVIGSSGTTVNFSGTPSINSGCGIYIESPSSASVLASGSPSVTVTGGAQIDMMGGTLGSVSYSPSPTTITTSPGDPMSGLTAPTASGCSSAGVVLSGSATKTFSPCVSGGTMTITSGITLSGTPTVTFDPGVYILQGGISMSGGTLNATGGVMLYAASGGVTMSAGTVNFVAPSSGAYQGIALFQPTTNSTAMTLSGGSGLHMTGAVYVPAANLTYSGGSGVSANNTTIVCKAITWSGATYINAAATTAYSGTSGPVLIE